MKFTNILKLAVSETRRSRGKLAFCVFSIAIGVFSLTAIRTALLSLEENINSQARSLMGADLLIHSPRPFGESAKPLFDELEKAGAKSAGIVEFYSMLYDSQSGRPGSENGTRLVRVRAVSGDFPLHGSIQTSPEGRWPDLLSGKRALIIPDSDVIDYLQLKPGSRVFLGAKEFRVEGSFVKQPGSPVSGFGFAPTVYINQRYLDATGLVQTGSRIRYSRYFATPPNFQLEDWKKEKWDFAVENDLTIQTFRESAESLQRFLLRLSNFLTAVGLITLLLGGLGIGAAMNVFMKDRLDHAAILRSLGATPGQIFLVYFSLAAFLGIVGSIIGVIPGAALPLALSDFAAARLAGNLLPVKLEIHFSLTACLDAVLSGAGASLLFTLFPIYRIRNVSPLRVLRKIDESGSAPGRSVKDRLLFFFVRSEDATVRDALVYLGGVLAIFVFILGVTATHTGSVITALVFTGAIAGSLLAINLLSRFISSATRRAMPWIGNFHLRQGIANLHRPGNQTGAVLTAAGIGTLLMSTIFVLEASIQNEISLEKKTDTPNLFIVDIQTGQKDALEKFLSKAGLTIAAVAPMVSARIQGINGKPIEKTISEQNAARRTWEDSLRTREYFLSYRDHLIESEELTDGRLWTGRPSEQEVSLDEKWASTMDVSLGDKITLDIQGIPLEARVTSLRKIRWQSMRPNAILLLSPGLIEEAPKMFVASVRYQDRKLLAPFQRELVRKFPNVSVIDAMEAVENVRFILDRISIVIRFLAAVTLFSGMLILIGAIAAGRYARMRESMLFKVLGASGKDLLKILVSEYSILALLGCISGWILSEAINRPFLSYFFDTTPTVPYGSILLLFAGIVILNTATGIFISRDVGRSSPMEVLREE